MNLQIIKIGNSKGIRIPQSILKQCDIDTEVSVEVIDGKIILTPVHKKEYDLSFNNLSIMSDRDIQLMLRKTNFTSLAIALLDSDNTTVSKVTKNMSESACEKLLDKISSFKEMDAKDLIVEMHKAKVDTILQDF